MAIQKGNRSQPSSVLRRFIAMSLFARRLITPPPSFSALVRRGATVSYLDRPLLGSCVMRAPVAYRNRHANELLDIADERHFVAIAQRNRDTVRARARRSTDAMYVGFR